MNTGYFSRYSNRYFQITTDSEMMPFLSLLHWSWLFLTFLCWSPEVTVDAKWMAKLCSLLAALKFSTDLHWDSSEASSFYRSCASAYVFAASQWGPLQTDRVVYYEGSDFMDYAPHSLAGPDKRLQRGTGRRLTGLEDSHSTALHAGNGCSIFVKVFMVSRL